MSNTQESRTRGRVGEDMAWLFLEARGYSLVARGFRAGRREIDLVVERGSLLVAVEVKWRRAGGTDEAAAQAWRPAQRTRAGDAVLEAMERLTGGTTRPWRFDLVTIEESWDGLKLTHRRGVWSPGNSFW